MEDFDSEESKSEFYGFEPEPQSKQEEPIYALASAYRLKEPTYELASDYKEPIFELASSLTNKISHSPIFDIANSKNNGKEVTYGRVRKMRLS